MDKWLKKYLLFGILTLILFFIFRPIFYAITFSSIGCGIIFWIYKKYKPKLNNQVLALDCALIFSFIGIPLILIIGWFSIPFLIDYFIGLYLKYPNFFFDKLLNFLSELILNFPTLFLYALMIFSIPLLFFKVMNIINSIKLDKYVWSVLIILFSPIEILYYFLIGRNSMKRKKLSTSKKI